MDSNHSTRRRARSGGITSTQVAGTSFEQHYSPAELATLWALSPNFIRRVFQDEEGVIVIDRKEKLHKRGYKTLRIPRSVALRVHNKLAA
jgi:hypothetical protein